MSKQSFSEFSESLDLDRENVENLKVHMRVVVEDQKLRDACKVMDMMQEECAATIKANH